MSQAQERIGFTLRQEEDVETFDELRDRVAAERGVEPADLANVDVIRHAAKGYLAADKLDDLRADKRLEDVRRLVARDHDMDPEDVSPQAAILQACAAYAGYQRVDDWLGE